MRGSSDLAMRNTSFESRSAGGLNKKNPGCLLEDARENTIATTEMAESIMFNQTATFTAPQGGAYCPLATLSGTTKPDAYYAPSRFSARALAQTHRISTNCPHGHRVGTRVDTGGTTGKSRATRATFCKGATRWRRWSDRAALTCQAPTGQRGLWQNRPQPGHRAAPGSQRSACS